MKKDTNIRIFYEDYKQLSKIAKQNKLVTSTAVNQIIKSLCKGYKVFNSDFTCKDFQHEVGEIGKTYEMKGTLYNLCWILFLYKFVGLFYQLSC